MTQAKTFALSGSSRTGLLVAGFLAAVTGLLVFAALRGGDDDKVVRNVSGGTETTVVTAKSDIPARTEITSDMLQLTKVPANALLAGAFSSRELVQGRIARIPIYKGEQLVQEKLASDRTDLGLSYIVPPGQRAMAVKVDKVVGAGGLIRPGDRVDVVGVVDVKYTDLASNRSFSEVRSFTVAQNVEVLAVEQALENQPPAVSNAKANGDGAKTEGELVEQPEAQPDGKVITLSLSPELTQHVLIAEEKGTIRLVVRAPGDNEVIDLDDTNFLALANDDFQKVIVDALRSGR